MQREANNILTLKSPTKKQIIEAQNLFKEAKRKKRSKRMYFGPDTHDAIIEYQSIPERELKNKLYEEKIKNSFEKLAENLIYIHNFSTDREHFHVLKSDTVSFLLSSSIFSKKYPNFFCLRT